MALPFHEVRGATGSGKDRINHFIWERHSGGGDRARDERNRRGGGRIRGKKGVIERGEEEKKLSRTDREEVWDEERERETGRDEGKQLPAQVSLLCSAMHSVRGRAWKERGGQG